MSRTSDGRATIGDDRPPDGRYPNTSHWGAFLARVSGGRVVSVDPHPDDPDPSPLLGNIADSAHHPSRVARPAVRRGWLEHGPGPSADRGRDPFVEVGWDEALDLVAAELERVRRQHGNEAIFGGSYGWASAGRFHHAQSQVHRFLNTTGGFSYSVNNYSHGTSMVLLPHVLGDAISVIRKGSAWPAIARHTELLVAFGGVTSKNVSVAPGGLTTHVARLQFEQGLHRGLEVASISPLLDDLPNEGNCSRYQIVPGTDTAMMLALAHTILVTGHADHAFLDRYCTGFGRFAEYLLGQVDGIVKDADWAAGICGIPADQIRALARRMPGRRTMITVTWSLQRTEHGEQPVWAAIALAAMLGQIGLPGGGFGHGYGSIGDVGHTAPTAPRPTLPQGRNPVQSFIPVARVADMLLKPGEPFDYDGHRHTYPDARVVYWAGGNPFHHHQDLNRLREAITRPDTIVVHEPYWTGMARHADVVLPVTIALERDDIGSGRGDTHIVPMRRAIPAYGEARDDYEVFRGLARRLGTENDFTEGRTARQWIEYLYEDWREKLGTAGKSIPEFATFWAGHGFRLPLPPYEETLFADFRHDPQSHPLKTPSGKIEIFSSVIADFGYDDCPGHPAWLEPHEWLGAPAARRYPLHLVANQPSSRLHSQLDMGANSAASKVAGREPIRLNPQDAAARGISEGDVVRVFNDRGACLAGAKLSDSLRPGVAQLSTGAWYDPDDEGLCRHGNPNVLTTDRGTSRLAQGCTGQHALVEVERYAERPPDVRAFEPPELVSCPRRP